MPDKLDAYLDPPTTPRNPRERVHSIASKVGISPDIADDYLKLTRIESGHNINVGNSSKGAQGFGQVMPDQKGGTTRTIGGQQYNLRDPDQNIEAGIRYFAEGGNDPVARRLHYFGGPGAKRRYERTGRIPNISDGNMTAQQYVRATGAEQQQKPTRDLDQYLDPAGQVSVPPPPQDPALAEMAAVSQQALQSSQAPLVPPKPIITRIARKPRTIIDALNELTNSTNQATAKLQRQQPQQPLVRQPTALAPVPGLTDYLPRAETPTTFEQDRAQRQAQREQLKRGGINPNEIRRQVAAELSRSETYSDQYGTRQRMSTPDVVAVEAETARRAQTALLEKQRKERIAQMGVGEQLAQIPKSAVSGFASGAGMSLKGIAALAKKIDIGGEYEGKETTDLATYRLGEYITKLGKDNPIFKSNPDLEQEFFVGKAPETIGQVAQFMLGGWATKSPKIAVAILGAGMTAGDAYDEVRALGGTDDEAVNAGLLAGGLLGPTELIGMRGAMKALEGTAKAAGWRAALQIALREGRRDVIENTLQEIGQGFGQGIITGNPRSLSQLAEAGALGAVGGTGTVPLTVASNVRRLKRKQPVTEPDVTVPESPAVEPEAVEPPVVDEAEVLARQQAKTERRLARREIRSVFNELKANEPQPITSREIGQRAEQIARDREEIEQEFETIRKKQIVKHSDPNIDGGEVIGRTADGRLKVKNNEGGISLVKDPRKVGNQEAALVTVPAKEPVQPPPKGEVKVSEGDSKALGVVYHQTPVGEIGEFRPWTHFGSIESANAVWPNFKKDVYEGEPSLATYPSRLDMRSPLRLEDGGDDALDADGWARKAAEQLKEQGVAVPQYPNAVNMLPVMKKAGYDGIVYKNTGEGGGDSWIITDSKQVSSAFVSQPEVPAEQPATQSPAIEPVAEVATQPLDAPGASTQATTPPASSITPEIVRLQESYDRATARVKKLRAEAKREEGSVGPIHQALEQAGKQARGLGMQLSAAKKATVARPVKSVVAEKQPETTAPALATGFTTAKGSTYEIGEKGTRRFKAATNKQYGESGQTIYVDRQTAMDIQSAMQATSLETGRPDGVVVRNEKDDQLYVADRKKDGGFVGTPQPIKYETTPQVGLQPVEIGGKVGIHVGHPITEVRTPPRTEAVKPVAPQPEVAETEPTQGAKEKVQIAGATYDLVGRNLDGTVTAKSEGGEFTSAPSETYRILDAPTKQVTKEALPATKEEFVDQEIGRDRARQQARLDVAIARINRDYTPKRLLSVGTSKVQSLLTQTRLPRELRKLVIEYEQAKKALDVDTPLNRDHYSNVYEQLKSRQKSVGAEGAEKQQPVPSALKPEPVKRLVRTKAKAEKPVKPVEPQAEALSEQPARRIESVTGDLGDVKTKPASQTGMDKSQSRFLAKALEENVRDLPITGRADTPITIKVPDDGEFTLQNQAAASKLYKKITGEPIEGIAPAKKAGAELDKYKLDKLVGNSEKVIQTVIEQEQAKPTIDLEKIAYLQSKIDKIRASEERFYVSSTNDIGRRGDWKVTDRQTREVKGEFKTSAEAHTAARDLNKVPEPSIVEPAKPKKLVRKTEKAEKPEPKKVRAARDRVAQRAADKAEGIELRHSGADPYQLIDDLIIRGWELYVKAKPKFAEWAKEMREEFGERAEPYLRSVYGQLTGDKTLKLVPPQPGETKERSFPKTAEAAGFEGGIDRDYEVLTNQRSLASASAAISSKGIDRSIADLVTKTDLTAEDTATGILLMQKLQQAGDIERAVDVASDLSRKLTQAGQSIQAASIVSRLSPEGVLLAAQRRMPEGKKLTGDQSKQLIELAGRVERAEIRIAEVQKQIEEFQKPKPKPRKLTKIGTLQDRLVKLEQEARARLELRAQQSKVGGSQLGASAIPLDIADYAIIGAAKIARKGITLSQWSAEMLKEFGDEIKPHLKKIYAESYKQYDTHRKEFQAEREIRGALKQDPKATEQDVKKLIEQRALARKDARTARAELANAFSGLTMTGWAKFKTRAADVLNIPRSIKSSLDLSAPRQGAIWMLNHPAQGLRLFFGKQLRAMREVNYDRFVDELEADPDYQLMIRSGLGLGSMVGDNPRYMLQREEAFLSKIAGNIPGVKQSERAFTTFLDTARVSWFKQLKNQAENKAASEGKEVSADQFKAIANFVNIATGRGNLGTGWINNASPFLNALFFAPKFAVSKVQVFDPRVYARMPAGARATAMREAMTYFGAMATTALLLKFGLGLTVGLDPEDSEFMKLRIGNTRYDLSNGTGQYIVLASRLLRNVENKRTGKKDKFGHSFWDNVDRFTRYKYSPPAALVRNTWEGKNAIGQKTNLKREAIESVSPLFLKELWDAYQEEGMTGAAKTAPGFVGVGVNTYNREKKAK